MAKKIVETPLMKQYAEIKRKHPDAILLFRVGDFYETFSDDAIEASRILGITLTRRANGAAQYVELAGFPHHALDAYLPKLVRAGKRVAICEQLEDPKATKKLVKRGITELVTPGVNVSETLLDDRDNNFLAGIHFGDHSRIGVAFLDISTGEFLCAEGSEEYAAKLLGNMSPKELLSMRGLKDRVTQIFSPRCPRFELDDWVYTTQAANDRLLKQFSTSSLKGFGIADMPAAVIAAGSLLYYLDSTHHTDTRHISSISRIDEGNYVHLNNFTVRNLEITEPLQREGKSLFDILDRTSSSMGARLLRRRLLFPLLDTAEINARLDAVEALCADRDTASRLASAVARIGDMERLIARISVRRAGPRDLVNLKDALHLCEELKMILSPLPCGALRKSASVIDPCNNVSQRIANTLRDDAPALVNKGNFIAEGVNTELDELRAISRGGKQALNNILVREVEKTGITSLKIGFNNVFGYYMEVRNTHKEKVPEEWMRKQTLVSAERYITPELKEYEEKILGAEERIEMLESRLFTELLDYIVENTLPIQRNAAVVANLDVMCALADCAVDYRYVRPKVDESLRIEIVAGRHPVIERTLPPGEGYIANNVKLDSDEAQIMMITGPNMSGKSALLRQTALITLMAQAGSFVPAESASVGIVDKIFTRVGASDNISQGESTFMVEMNEAAAIINNMSERSLILFDELGRGTSTYDGISIAWAIVEHIHENGRCRPKTLFATHYHELNEMEKAYRRIRNFNVAVEEIEGKVVFLRKLLPGGSAHSFGIHVAALAGIPPSIVKRANTVLERLENSASTPETGVGKPAHGEINASADGYQLSFFQLDDPLLHQVRDSIIDLDIDNLTPIQALAKLHDLRMLLKG